MSPDPSVSVGPPIPLAASTASNPAPAIAPSPRRRFRSEIFGNDVVVNVTEPTLTPVLPAARCGTAMIVVPGGGFHALSIDSEGFDVASWLAGRGIAAFVLEYHLVPGGDDPVAELFRKPPEQAAADMDHAGALASRDAAAAIRLVRDRADEFGVSPDRVGVIGFSAGGNVVLRAALTADAAARPDFLAAVYAATRGVDLTAVPNRAGPAFVLAATDDQLGLADDSVRLYEAWRRSGAPAELHLYARGGHGFGMKQQGAPTDDWIDRLGAWLADQGLLAR